MKKGLLTLSNSRFDKVLSYAGSILFYDCPIDNPEGTDVRFSQISYKGDVDFYNKYNTI